MQVRDRFFQVFFLGSSLGLMHCEESVLEQQCKRLCSSLGCGDGVVFSDCKKQCLHRMDEAEALGDLCGKAYQGMLECLFEVKTCGGGGIGDWDALRGTEFEYPCRPETEDFLDECGELWFEDERGLMKP